jgi:SAM-dependent methyltransferase
VWVPTPSVLVEKMLDLAKVTPADYVMDLGSGDGRNIIAAAKRGARALGVEYNPDMVKLSQQIAAKEGVATQAQFVEGDMYAADISQATVLALFLLPENLDRLLPKFLDLRPGSRIVLNTFGITGWAADRVEFAEGDCGQWCEALLYIVPAKVAGQWKLPQGVLTLEQRFQMLSGSLDSGGEQVTISEGRVNGDQIRFTAGGIEYTGKVSNDTIEGRAASDAAPGWTATRQH